MPTWQNFLEKFYLAEFERETQTLGDIDIRPDDKDSTEPTFVFTLDEVKKQYTDFLNLAAENEPNSEVEDEKEYNDQIQQEEDEQNEKEHDQNQEDSSDQNENQNEQENRIPSQESLQEQRDRSPSHENLPEEHHLGSTELLQEIKDLDEHNPETAYVDFKYWKPLIDYSVDDLMNELKS